MKQRIQRSIDIGLYWILPYHIFKISICWYSYIISWDDPKRKSPRFSSNPPLKKNSGPNSGASLTSRPFKGMPKVCPKSGFHKFQDHHLQITFQFCYFTLLNLTNSRSAVQNRWIRRSHRQKLERSRSSQDVHSTRLSKWKRGRHWSRTENSHTCSTNIQCGTKLD